MSSDARDNSKDKAGRSRSQRSSNLPPSEGSPPPSNKLGAEISSAIAKSQAAFVAPQFLAGFDDRHRIGWVFSASEFLFFRQVAGERGPVFETRALRANHMAKFSLLDPVIARLGASHFAFVADETDVYIQAIFGERPFSQTFELISGQASIQGLALAEEGPQEVELRVLDNWGRVFSLAVTAGLEVRARIVETLASSGPGLLANIFGKRGGPGAGPALNRLLLGPSRAPLPLVKVFNHSLFVSFENKAARSLSGLRPRELWESVKVWERDFLAINRFNFIDHRFLDFCVVGSDADSVSLLCVYVLYVISKESLDLLIVKGRLLAVADRRFESLREEILFETLGGAYDAVAAKLAFRDPLVYLAVNVSSVVQQKSQSYVVRTDKALGASAEKFFAEPILGVSAVADPAAAGGTNCLVFLADRFESFERESAPDLAAPRPARTPDAGKSLKKLNSGPRAQDGRRTSREKDADFRLGLLQVFGGFAAGKLDPARAAQQLAELGARLGTENATEEVRAALYQILEEQTRDLVLAVRYAKEDLELVGQLKKEKRGFDDIITIELRKKRRRLDQFMELLALSPELGRLELVGQEYWSLREALAVLLAFRGFERDSARRRPVAALLDAAVARTLAKWRLPLAQHSNADAFYTNVVSGHEVFAALNELLGEVADRGERRVLADAVRDLWVAVLLALWDLRDAKRLAASGLSLVFRRDSNLFYSLCAFFQIYRNAVFDFEFDAGESADAEKFAELIRLLIYETDFQRKNAAGLKIDLRLFARELFGQLARLQRFEEAFELARQ